jgi:hypothetical protein
MSPKPGIYFLAREKEQRDECPPMELRGSSIFLREEFGGSAEGRRLRRDEQDFHAAGPRGKFAPVASSAPPGSI